MPATKAFSNLIPASTLVAAGKTKSTAVVGSVVDARTSYGGELVWRIINSGALGTPCTILFQVSPDGTNWFDYYSVSSSNLTAGTITEGPSVTLSRGGMYLRALAYGNETNPCSVEAGVMLTTGL